MKKVLEIGCGKLKSKDSVGIDIVDLDGVDIVHDLNVIPYPIGDETFDKVIARHTLSHLNDLPKIMDEIYRILKENGVFEIYVPHYASDNYNTDPTHKISFGIRTMNYFISNTDFKLNYYSKCKFILEKRHISFYRYDSKFSLFNPFKLIGLEFIFNLFPRLYEKTLAYIIQPSEIYFKLRKKCE